MMSSRKKASALWIAIFAASFSSGGSHVYAALPFAIGGSGLDYGKDLRVDGAGNIYSGGYFAGAVDFDPNAGTYNLTATGAAVDNYLAKYDPNGNHQWSIRFGGSGNDIPHTIRVDSAGNTLMGGYFSNSAVNGGAVSFNPVSNQTQYTLTSAGLRDPYIAKYNTNGQYVWHAGVNASIATPNYDETYDINSDSAGNVYACGLRNGDVAPPNPLTVAGGWVAKYNSSGASQWQFNLGSGTTGVVQAFSVGTLSNGTVVVAGQFNTPTDFNHGAGAAITLSPTGNADVFLAKYDATTGNCLSAVKLGGTGFDTASPGGMRIYGNDNIYLTGNLSGTVDPDNNATTSNSVTSHGSGDILLAKYDSNLSSRWTTLVGGPAGDGGHRIELDSLGNPILTGWFRANANFGSDKTLTARSSTVAGQDPAASDIFLAKFDAATGLILWVNGFGDEMTISSDFALGAGLGVDGLDRIYLGGRFTGTVDWDPSAATAFLTASGPTDAFVARYDSNGNIALVPEPTTTVGLAVGSMIMLLRRCRRR